MKLLAIGDLHLGASPDLGATPGDRLADQAVVLRRVAKLAMREQVGGVLFLGDAFHRRRPTPSELMVWRGFVEVLGDEGIGMLAISGNHDVESEDRPTGLEVVSSGSGAHYDPVRRPGVSYAFPGVAVATLPWTAPARLLASRNGGNRDETNHEVATLLIDAARDLRAEIEEFDPECVAILCLHWSISGSSLPNGLPVDQLREPILPLSELEALGFDVVAASHIHKPQLLSPGQLAPDENGSHVVPKPCRIFYTGSPAVVDFGEAATEHGVWIMDTEADWLRFHPIEDRRFVTVDVDLTTDRHTELGLDETGALAAAFAAHLPLTDAVVRVRYRCTADQARRVDVAALRGFLREAGVSKVFSLAPIIERGERARVEGVDESMGELEALDAWIESVGCGPPEDLRALTARYLEEVAA